MSSNEAPSLFKVVIFLIVVIGTLFVLVKLYVLEDPCGPEQEGQSEVCRDSGHARAGRGVYLRPGVPLDQGLVAGYTHVS